MKITNGIVKFILLGINLLLLVLLQGCADSAVSREANDQVTAGYIKTTNSMTPVDDIRLGDTYQNSTQTTKGLVLGGISGALVGSTMGIGFWPGLAGGAIAGGAFGSYLDHYTTLADRLENRHVKVMKLGDQVMIISSSDQIFNGQTANINPVAYSTLDLVAQLINTYRTESVRIVVYADSSMTASVADALTREQANNIAKYLWKRGINTRMLYAVGAGGAHVVSQSTIDSNETMNYRVEISLEKLPV